LLNKIEFSLKKLNSRIKNLRVKLVISCFFAFFLSSLIFLSCDSIPDKVVDLPEDNYSVIGINHPQELLLVSSKGSLIYSIEIDNPSAVENVYSKILSGSSEEVIFTNIILRDDGDQQNYADLNKGDGIFTTKVEFDTSIASGKYFIEYYVETINKTVKKVAVANFTFDNGKNNLPPIISNLVIPDSIARNVSFVFSIKASDPNGLKQIKSVYFQLYRPDGSQVVDNNSNPNLSMQDNGNEEIFGDLFAGDGIFSFKNSFSATAQLGKWTFKFRAVDFSNALSNEIAHELTVVE